MCSVYAFVVYSSAREKEEEKRAFILYGNNYIPVGKRGRETMKMGTAVVVLSLYPPADGDESSQLREGAFRNSIHKFHNEKRLCENHTKVS